MGILDDAIRQSLQLGARQALGGNINPTASADPSAPGITQTYQSSALGEATEGLIDPTIAAAQNIYAAGTPELNPLLQGYFDASAGLIDQAAGTDPYTQELATRALTQSQSPFFAAGTPGSARAAYAGGAAITDTLLDRQRQARQDLAQAGGDYQNWQTNADWNWLGQFQDAIQFGKHVPSTTEVIQTPSGAQQLAAQRSFQAAVDQANAANQQGAAQGQYHQGSWYSPLVNAGVGHVVDTATDWIGGFFNEGGEVKKEDWF